MRESLRIVLADDHPLTRMGLHTMLAGVPGIDVVGEAGDGDTAQHLCREVVPDVLLLDVRMPGPSAIETVTTLRAQVPQMRIVMLTAYDDDAYVRGLLHAGASGYVLKDDPLDRLVEAIRTVARGERWVSQAIMAKLVHWSTTSDTVDQVRLLSERELEVVKFLSYGWTNTRIGEELAIGERTVRYHLQNIYPKLGMRGRGEVIAWATRAGLGEQE